MNLKNVQHFNKKNVYKMFLFVFLLCCVLQPMLHYYSVFGKRESLQRFVVEDGAKPPIFGSYSYDPVKQVFVPPPPDTNDDNDTSKHQLTHSATQRTTQTNTETQKDIQTNPQSNQLTSTPSAVSLGQSRLDSFISTAGDTGMDSHDTENKMLRKHVPPLDNKPWREQPRTIFKNITFNVLSQKV